MAYFDAYGRFSPKSFNLNDMWRRTSDTHFQNNWNESHDGVSYTDTYDYNWFGNKNTFTTTVAGPILTVDNSGAFPELTGGTMTGLFEYTYNNLTPVLRFSVQDFVVSAATFAAAAGTKARADDWSFLKTVFSTADVVTLSRFNDVFRGHDGNDQIYGYGGKDVLSGNKGSDRLYGGADSDVLMGNKGGDWMSGQFGHDTLIGGPGQDIMLGSKGADVFIGGPGADNLYAGSDAWTDAFIYKRVGDSMAGAATRDRIYKFDSGEDKIDLSGIDGNASLGGNQKLAVSPIGPAAHSVWLVGNTKGIFVRADVDGDAVADLEIQLPDLMAMNSNDLIL